MILDKIVFYHNEQADLLLCSKEFLIFLQNVKKFCLQRVFRSCTTHSYIPVLLGIHRLYSRIPNVNFFAASGYTIITKNVNHFDNSSRETQKLKHFDKLSWGDPKTEAF